MNRKQTLTPDHIHGHLIEILEFCKGFQQKLLDLEQNQERVIKMLRVVNLKENFIMAKIDDVTAAVEAETAVDDSAIVLLNNLTAMIKAAGTDPAKLDALISTINANKQKMADAIVANTPAESGGSTVGSNA